jgi:hypothetical protein
MGTRSKRCAPASPAMSTRSKRRLSLWLSCALQCGFEYELDVCVELVHCETDLRKWYLLNTMLNYVLCAPFDFLLGWWTCFNCVLWSSWHQFLL